MIYIEMLRKMILADRKFFFNLGTLVAIFTILILGLMFISGLVQTVLGFHMIYTFGQIFELLFFIVYTILIAFYFSFVKLWLVNNPIYNRYLGKKSFSNHLSDIFAARSHIDNTTGDDVHYTLTGSVDRYGRLYNTNVKETRYRETANSKKEKHTNMYLIRYTLGKAAFFTIAWTVTPFLALIALPLLKKQGLEAILDETLTASNTEF